jgi:hypothetical protein
VPQHTGNAGMKTTAWGEPVFSLSLQQRPQRRFANRDSSPAATALPETHSHAGTFPLAPAESAALPTNPRSGEAQAQAREQVVDKAYRLTRYDLSLERERATKSGG